MKVYRRNGHYWLTDGTGKQRVQATIHRLYHKLTGRRILPVRTKAEANYRAVEIFKLLHQPETGVTPFDKALAEFLTHCQRRGLAQNTQKIRCSHLQEFTALANIRLLADITPGKIQDYLDKLTCSNRTKNSKLISISCLCKWCRRAGMLRDNPARDVMRYKEIDPKIGKFVSFEDYQELLRNTDPVTSAIIQVGYHTGRRIGEILWLWKQQWEPVNLKLQVLVFPKDVTKSSRPEIVPFNREALKAFSWLKNNCVKRPPTVNTFSTRFHDLTRRLGMTYRFHDLRVTFSTRLREAGYGDTEIMFFLGQNTPGLAAKTYTKHQISHLRKAVDSI